MMRGVNMAWKPGRMAALLLGGILLPSAALGQAAEPDLEGRFEHVYVFGDSLSDSGNVYAGTDGAIPTSPPYFEGRFSNGPVWVERLADDLAPMLVDPEAPSRSYAAGGARTDAGFDLDAGVPPGILSQLSLFRINFGLTDTDLGPSDLVTLWAGANNIFDASGHIARNPGNFPDEDSARAYLLDVSEGAVADLDTALGRLIDSGATTVLVPNIPDLGLIPRFNRDPVRAARASLASARFNEGLATMLAATSAEAGGEVNIVSMDVETLFNLVRARPQDFGFANAVDPCLNQVAEVDLDTLTICAPDAAGQNAYVFWDEIHPTTATHAIIARTAIGLLTADRTLETPMTFSETGLIAARAIAQDLSQRLAQRRAGGTSPDGRRFALFLSGSHGSGDRQAEAPLAGLRYDLDTISGGGEIRLGDRAVAGLALSHACSRNRVADGTRFDAKAWQGTLFAGWAGRGFDLDASLARGWIDFGDYVRPTALAPIRASGKTKGRYWTVTGEAGLVRRLGALGIGIDGGLRYTDLRIDGFAEEQAPLFGLDVGRQKANSFAALAGLSAAWTIRAGDWSIVPRAAVTYEAELDGKRRGSGRLIGNTANPFAVADSALDGDSVAMDAGVLLHGKSLQLLAGFRQRWDTRYDGDEQQVTARLSLPF